MAQECSAFVGALQVAVRRGFLLETPSGFPDNDGRTGRLRYLLKTRVDSHVDRLMREGLSLLSGGRGREASLRFSRVLLDDPGHEEARRGEERVRALLGEEERLATLRVHEARSALAAGEAEAARRLATEARKLGADPDAVHALLDRLDERSGRLASQVAPFARPLASPVRPAGAGLSRVALLAAWAIGIGLLLGAVATSWEQIVSRLARAPWPRSSAAPEVSLAPAQSGDSALVEARRLLLAGQAQGALRALDRISAGDPNYPYARRLRAEAESALAAPEATK